MRLAARLSRPVAQITQRALRLGSSEDDYGYARFARDIAQACAHLEEVLRDLDGVRRTDAPTAVDVCALVDATALLFAPIAEGRDIRFSVAGTAGSALLVTAEQKKLRQVLINLFSNALKFSGHGGQVDVRVDGGAEITVTVRDSGPGIAREDRARIFERFERLGSQTEGRGIGLSIAADYVGEMGGRLFVADADGSVEGKGATFVLALPNAATT